MSVLMIFIDGVGLGDDDPTRNPLATTPMPVVNTLLGGGRLVSSGAGESGLLYASDDVRLLSVDAGLGVPGLPQSATGQTTLLSGVNASQALGRHLSGLPTVTLVDILRQHSLFKRLREAGLRATFANPFTDDYFAAVKAGRWRHSATTTAVLGAGLPVRMLDDLHARRAIFHDVTGEGLRKRGHDVPLISPEEAGRRLASLTTEHDFTLFEHFLTDFAGHAQDWDEARRLLTMLDAMLGAALAELDLKRTTVLVISDHGNLEDLSVKTHTLNPVPGLLIGAGGERLARDIRSLVDVTPAIVAYLSGQGNSGGQRDE